MAAELFIEQKLQELEEINISQNRRPTLDSIANSLTIGGDIEYNHGQVDSLSIIKDDINKIIKDIESIKKQLTYLISLSEDT